MSLRAYAPGAVPAWMDDALCQQVDADSFYPDKGAHATAAFAKGICARCGVRAQCLQYALDTHEPHGIWGGLTERERRNHLTVQAAKRTAA